MFAAAAVMGRGSYTSLVTERALHRFAGTTIGVLIAGIVVWADPRTLILATVLAVLMFLGELTITRNYALGLLFITPWPWCSPTAVPAACNQPHRS